MEEDNNSRISNEEACVTSKDEYLSNKLTDSTNTNFVSSNLNNDSKNITAEEVSAVADEDDEENRNNNNDENDENAIQIANDANDKADDDKNNHKSCQLALSRIKTIMKLDPDLGLVSKESLYVITKATVRNILIIKF
jgi:hypothetical protein